jgi:PUB domain
MMQQKFEEQKEIIENLSKQVAELQYKIETLKISNNPQILDPEVVDNLYDSINSITDIEKPQQNIDEIFENCFSSLSESNKGLALKTMKMWFQNILNNPSDKQKSRINTTNPQYKNYFAGNNYADQLFTFVGFQVRGSFLEFEQQDLNNLKAVLDKITEGISLLPSQVFSNSAPWQLAKPAQKIKEKLVEAKKETGAEEIKAAEEQKDPDIIPYTGKPGE